MTIALDYDNTYTADPPMWDAFIGCAQGRGHTVIIATGRRENDPATVPGVKTIYCGHSLKEHACRAAGINVDIWIDDMPGMIQECRIIGGGWQ